MDIKIVADYHTHTTFSDGVGSIRDNVEAARAMGIRTIGITDHGFWHIKHGISHKDVAKMRAEIERLRTMYPDMQILLGVEANLINLKGELDMTQEDFALFDYCIFGVHKLAFSFKKPSSIWFTLCNFINKSERRRQKVTDSYITAIKKYPVKFVVHPNYATRVDVARLAQVAKEKGVYIELNGKRIEMDDHEAKALIDSGVKLVLSSDAHSPSRVGECSLPKEFIEKHNIPLQQIVNIDSDLQG